MKIICVIPARLHSTRLNNKMLIHFNKKSLLQHTWEAANKVKIFDQVVIAVDDPILYNHVITFTSNCILTSNKHISGTSRMLEVYSNFSKKNIFFDLWINWQGDEPLISKNAIYDLVSNYNTNFDIATLRYKISNKSELFNPKNVKVVTDINSKAMYFSRYPIPYVANLSDYNLMNYEFYKHIGIYMYTNKTLMFLKEIIKHSSYLEDCEKLEQLTFLYNDIKIQAIKTSYPTCGVDTPEDITFYKKKLLLY